MDGLTLSCRIVSCTRCHDRDDTREALKLLQRQCTSAADLAVQPRDSRVTCVYHGFVTSGVQPRAQRPHVHTTGIDDFDTVKRSLVWAPCRHMSYTHGTRSTKEHHSNPSRQTTTTSTWQHRGHTGCGAAHEHRLRQHKQSAPPALSTGWNDTSVW